ncbi:dynein regulatory complex protein 1 isoform X2 [Manacus candei]|uniref:dynein regulatory complex protein 1 isoform X2 n=1 Tax=Manacus candei TaxID=415023 RepID=UPI0022262535|nr:dynein regulatory complex protein 1 isoform X2 [Manacus candei]
MENREGGAAPAALHEIREPSPGPEPSPDLHLGAAAAAESGPEPGAAAEAASERAERIGARRSRVEARRRAALGIVEEVEEEEEEEEEEQRKSLALIEETEKALAKLLFHGTQLVTDVRVDSDFREFQRREREAKERRDRLERLEREAQRSTEKLGEINSGWVLAQDSKIPQELQELLKEQQENCERLLREKNRLIRDLREELEQKDERYERALQEQRDEIQLLLERMEEQTRNLLQTYRKNLRQIEETFEEERREMLENRRKKWDETIRAQNEQHLEFLRGRMERAEEFERHLEELQDQDVANYDRMKLQLEKDVQYLERKLQEMKGIFHLNKVKLEYNLEVLRQQDLENSTLRSLQKRRITRLQGALSNLNSRLEKQERKFREEKQSLECDRERIKGQQEETRSRMRHFSVTGLAQFRRVWLVNEEEAKELIRKALEADRLIHVQQLGIPWEEPLHWFLENVGPLGEKPEKRTALRAAREALEEENSGKPPEDGKAKKKKGLGSGNEGKGIPGKAGLGSRPLGNVPKETIRRILELLRDESGFLMEKELLKPLQELEGPPDTLGKIRSLFQALRIEDEDDLFQLVDSFLKHKSREAPEKSQNQGSAGGEIPDPAEEGGASSRQEELRCSRNSRSSVRVHRDDVPKILKEFLRNFDRLRDAAAAAAREALDIRDSSGDAEYWEALAHVIPEPKLKLWDALDAALLEYHRVLSRRAELLSQATLLQQQNSELGMLLEEYLRSKASG